MFFTKQIFILLIVLLSSKFYLFKQMYFSSKDCLLIKELKRHLGSQCTIKITNSMQKSEGKRTFMFYLLFKLNEIL